MPPVKARNVRVPQPPAANQLLATVLEKCQPTPDDPRPVLLFIAGPNGSGKSSIFELVRQAVGPHIFVNADLLAKVLPNMPAHDEFAQKVADQLREHCLLHHQSFATESVLSDEVGAKPAFLVRAEAQGFHVVFLYVAISSPALSKARVAARVVNGGHSVPPEKLERRYHASLANCKRVLRYAETGILLENSGDFSETPFNTMAITSFGQVEYLAPVIPEYIQPLLPGASPPGKGQTKKPRKPPAR